MNALQGIALGFIAGSLYVLFALPWLQRKLADQIKTLRR